MSEVLQDLWNHMKGTTTIQVGGSPAKFFQVFPFMTGLSTFVNHNKKKARGGGRAAEQAHMPAPAQAPSPAPAAPARPADGKELQPFHGGFDEGMAWEPSDSGGFGFEEMVQQNERLRRGDAMRPYDGIIPAQQQVMQRKALQVWRPSGFPVSSAFSKIEQAARMML